MNVPQQRILVLGLGNDILGDDAVGLIAAVASTAPLKYTLIVSVLM